MRIVLETPRLILGEFTEEDAPLILHLNSDPEVVKYVHEPVLTDVEAARKILVDIILPQYENNLGRWATYSKFNNEFIGWCGLKYRPEWDEIDLGYRFKRSAWGKGYATEAAASTLRHGLYDLDLPRITGRAHIENHASLKVLEKIGMQFLKQEEIDGCPVKTYFALKQRS